MEIQNNFLKFKLSGKIKHFSKTEFWTTSMPRRFDVVLMLENLHLYSFYWSFNTILNPLSARAFFRPFFKKISKIWPVTQFLRNESTKIQSFVYQFVENFKLLLKLKISKSWLYPELQLSEMTTVSCRIYSWLALKGFIL